jgi:hypothetical protein
MWLLRTVARKSTPSGAIKRAKSVFYSSIPSAETFKAHFGVSDVGFVVSHKKEGCSQTIDPPPPPPLPPDPPSLTVACKSSPPSLTVACKSKATYCICFCWPTNQRSHFDSCKSGCSGWAVNALAQGLACTHSSACKLRIECGKKISSS